MKRVVKEERMAASAVSVVRGGLASTSGSTSAFGEAVSNAGKALVYSLLHQS